MLLHKHPIVLFVPFMGYTHTHTCIFVFYLGSSFDSGPWYLQKDAKIKKKLRQEYVFADQGRNLRGTGYNLTLVWNVMPRVGKFFHGFAILCQIICMVFHPYFIDCSAQNAAICVKV